MANDELERFRLNFSRYAHSDVAPLNSNYPSKKHKMSVVQPDEFFFFIVVTVLVGTSQPLLSNFYSPYLLHCGDGSFFHPF